VIFLDTNVLMYASGADDSSLAKTGIARRILRATTGVGLSLQVLQEFYVSATRITRRSNLSHAEASRLVRSWQRFRVLEPSVATMASALAIRERFRFAYWDCAILAAALELGCETLYSEDLQHGQRIDGLLIVNPFREGDGA
jgi:predicted nucleic acid-binding protein